MEKIKGHLICVWPVTQKWVNGGAMRKRYQMWQVRQMEKCMIYVETGERGLKQIHQPNLYFLDGKMH